jgi:hypothetical protein
MRVSEEDYQALIQTPRLDAAVLEHLPQSGKAAPPGFSPFWEGELANLDSRLAAGIRMAGVATTVADHLSRTVASQCVSDHPLVQEAMLLTEFNMHLMRTVMSTHRRITELRRQQVCEHIGPSFGTNFLKLVHDKDIGSQASLFGGNFGSKLKERAEVVSNEVLVKKDAETVRKAANKSKGKHKKAKPKKSRRTSKAKSSSAAAPAPPAPAATPAPAPAATSTAPKAGKRTASNPLKSRKSKKARRGGKGGRS